MSIVRRRKTSDYASLHNGLLKDKRLSYSAIGLASYLLSLPEDWIIVKEQIYNHSERDGRKVVDRCFQELLQYGYVISGSGYGMKDSSRSKRPVKQYEYIISDIPFTAEEIDEFYLELCQKWKSVSVNPCNYSNLSTVQKVQYMKNSTKGTPTKKDIKKNGLQKDFEEEEELTTSSVSEADIIYMMNTKIKEREITNQKTITAILDVANKCRAIGGSDYDAAANYVIKVVEEKMSKLGQKQREKQPNKASGKKKPGSGRGEILPEWLEAQKKLDEYERTLSDDEKYMLSDLRQNGKNDVFIYEQLRLGRYLNDLFDDYKAAEQARKEITPEQIEKRRKLEEALKKYRKE